MGGFDFTQEWIIRVVNVKYVEIATWKVSRAFCWIPCISWLDGLQEKWKGKNWCICSLKLSVYKDNFYAGIACSQSFYLSLLHLGTISIYRGFYFHSRTRLFLRENRCSVICLTNSCKVFTGILFFSAVVQMHLSFYVANKTIRTKFSSLNAIWIDGRSFKQINYRIKDEELGRSYWK